MEKIVLLLICFISLHTVLAHSTVSTPNPVASSSKSLRRVQVIAYIPYLFKQCNDYGVASQLPDMNL